MAKEGSALRNPKNNLNRLDLSRKSVVFGVIVLLLISSISVILPGMVGETGSSPRTGSEGNEPSTGFSEGNDTFEILHDNGTRNTTFLPGENVTISITSTNVNWGAGGNGRRNNIVVSDYSGNKLIDESDNNAFQQQISGPPYIYNFTFIAPLTQDHYLVFAELRDSPPQGRDFFSTSDLIQVWNGTGQPPQSHLFTFSEPACLTLDWVFGTGDIVYLKVNTTGTINPDNSIVRFADYFDNSEQIDIVDLVNNTVIQQGNDSIIAFDLFNDLDITRFPDHELKGGYWYTIGVDLEDQQGGPMAVDWAAQIMILPPPDISFLDCYPNQIYADSINSTTIFTEFSDENATNVDEFNITFKVRDPNNNVIHLLENKSHGQDGLTVIDLGGQNFNASYTWTPLPPIVYGTYDLHTTIYDGQNGVDVSGFNDNQDELLLEKPGVLPKMNASNTSCIPGRVNKMSNEQVIFTINFSDENDPPFNVNEFDITLKIRDQDSNEILMVDNQNSGDSGNTQGPWSLLITNDFPPMYNVSISWDPDENVPVGEYDLSSSITTTYGTLTDVYANNPNELEIYSTGYSPELTVGDTECDPWKVDIIGDTKTEISCYFTDLDNPATSEFNVTFKIRPPNNRMADVITLVDDKPNGGEGELGGTVSIIKSVDIYQAKYEWDPPLDYELGTYDLYFMVRDDFNNTAEDPFAQNLDELELVSSVDPPTITAGDTECDPPLVNKIGPFTTKIHCNFQDSNYTSINDFNITFKVRDPNGIEIVLVDNKPHDASGEDPNQPAKVEITTSGSLFTAWYEWDPPLTVEAGQYDLYFSVMNKAGGFASDKFENNLNELTIETTGNPPEILNVRCTPNAIPITGTNSTTIYANFTDDDNPPVENFTVTFKVRDPDDNVIVLVNDKTHGGAGELDGTVSITNNSLGYNASYVWDPADDTKAGMYDLYFAVKDETLAGAVDDFDDNEDELELIKITPKPPEPELEPKTTTQVDNKVTFSVTFTDPNNNPPDEDGVRLYIDSTSYKMEESDPNDTNYTNGKEYEYTIELDEGDYTYYFKVNNVDNETVKGDDLSLHVTPFEPEEPEEKDKEKDNTGLYAGIAAVIIIIILLLLFMMLRKRGLEPEAEEKPPLAKPVEGEAGEGEESPPMAATVGEGEGVEEGEAEEKAESTEESEEEEVPKEGAEVAEEPEPTLEAEAPVDEEAPEAETAEEPVKEEETPEEEAEEPVKEGEVPPTEEAPPEETAPEPDAEKEPAAEASETPDETPAAEPEEKPQEETK
jgi:hypothetical protein